MGLLDDAIRDHLELKRRRGADPAEVERAEKEALGPVRRQPEGSDDLDYADEPISASESGAGGSDELFYDDDEPLAYEDDLEPDVGGWEDAPAHEPEPPAPTRDPAPAASSHDVAPAPEAERFNEPEPERVDQPHPGIDTKPHEAVRPEPSAPAVPAQPVDPTVPPPHRAGGVGEETAEYDVEAEQRAADEREDVLEETPEFLQDTPDHDRLWFEQRPPRDFNFDG